MATVLACGIPAGTYWVTQLPSLAPVADILNPPAILYHIDYTLVGLLDLVAVVTVLGVLYAGGGESGVAAGNTLWGIKKHTKMCFAITFVKMDGF